jgi:ABC-type multidrug transport system fused ATPase/permease subunit
MMFETFRKLLDLLTPAERRRGYLLVGLIVLEGLVQMIGIASILPFLAVLANPEVIETNARLNALYTGLGFESPHRFLVFLGVAIFCLVFFGLLFRTFTHYAIYRFVFLRGYAISSRLLAGYLGQPYGWFLNQHSAQLGANILADVQKVVGQALMPAMRLMSHGVVTLALIGLLVAVQPKAALVLAVMLGGSYGLIYAGVRRRLHTLGEARYLANHARFQAAGDAVGGIKDVKVLGLERTYLRRFQTPALEVARYDAAVAAIGEVPRHVLEAIGFGGMLLFILVMLATGDGHLGAVLPVLGVYAFAGLRLFPALQQVYGAFTALRFAKPTLDKLHADLVETRGGAALPTGPDPAPLGLRDRLELAGIEYAYPRAERPALRGVDMTIPARTTVGLVGGTGAGKTTAVDLILGLLEPTKGTIRVDGVPVAAANRRAWQRTIGYVPQTIFLTDESVAANIAFGLPPEAIDRAAVERAARTAELHDFVTAELPQGYDTPVGERGVRLSGGQRQRIGIARALYHDPDVLILDEATSALDNLTEKAVMDAVHNLGHAKTIILIAHRLSTVRACDIIFMMEQGRVVAQGRYDELIAGNQTFRAMAGGHG